MTPKRKIFKITIRHILDENPDTSWMGEYSDTRTSEYSIDRQERGECGCGEYRYFNPSFNYVDKTGKALAENTPEEVHKYVAEDYARMERLNAGGWYFMGIKAVAEVGLSKDGGHYYKIDRLTSGGLWGIESDSEPSYIAEVEQDELADLKSTLLAYGFGRSVVAKAIKAAEVQE
jgi:hypothetical protein